jgi:hypothetical protein
MAGERLFSWMGTHISEIAINRQSNKATRKKGWCANRADSFFSSMDIFAYFMNVPADLI